MFSVYIDKKAYSKILQNRDKHPYWFKILKLHSDVFLNVDDQFFQREQEKALIREELSEDTLLLLNALDSGRLPQPLLNFFEEIYSEINEELNSYPSTSDSIRSKPRAVLILDITQAKAQELQKKFGFAFISANELEKGVFHSGWSKNFRRNEIVQNGWADIYSKFTISPSNSIVVTDPYLFSHETKDENLGEGNIIRMIEQILPKQLDIDYHITILTSRKMPSGKDIPVHKFATISNRLVSRITGLRPYKILVEIINSETIHPRLIITNYAFSKCEKGFKVFNPSQYNMINDSGHDFIYKEAFAGLEDMGGSIPFQFAENYLEELKVIYERAIRLESLEKIVFRNFEQESPTPVNRLLLDV
jgi:hypothetical protein